MRNSCLLIAVATVTLISATARADYPMVNMVAEKIINKYQTSSCEQLKLEKAERQGKPKSDMEQRAIQVLHEDAGARADFFQKISTPVLSKLFECNMIP
jgi:hypothetical protein